MEPRISVETTLIDLGRLTFRRSFGPPDLTAWHELLDCIALHDPDVEQAGDHISWRLDPSSSFSTKSLYRAIAPTPSLEPLVLIWWIQLPLKIRIFMWQWIRGRVPSGVEVLKQNVPGDRICPLCGTEEGSNIIFSCVSAQFLWSCLRGVVGGNWCHNNFPTLFAELQASALSVRHIRWLTVGVLAWTL
ncbi:uncharacterized protein [Aegilops tauschii subsp. strangulata]|uniref:uncharacterized protein n=1 Tax=Aegilops tauschii subsp. strangulata TaxID=200361 RepID=UPI003CC84827